MSYRKLLNRRGKKPIYGFGEKAKAPPKQAKKRIVNTIQRVLDSNSEFKHYTLTAQSLVMSTSIGSFNLLTGITEGDDVVNRTGRQINVRSIQVSGYFTLADTTNICRVALVQELENSATLATDLWNTPSVNALRKNETMGKYRVIWDYKTVLDGYQPVKIFKKFSRMNIKVKYNATDGTPIKNHMMLVFISDSSAVVHPSYYFDVRIFYTDL